jgi:hypothetical protein
VSNPPSKFFMIDGPLMPPEEIEKWREKWAIPQALAELDGYRAKWERSAVRAQEVIAHLASRRAADADEAVADAAAIRRITLALNEICGEDQNG